MLSRLACLALLALALAPAASAQDIYLRSQTNLVPQAELSAAVPAFQASVDKLRRWWGGERTIIHAGRGPWQITVTGPGGPFDPYGYHFIGPRGLPYALVFYDSRLPWSVVVSHELDEMVVDPQLTRTLPGSREWLVEVADPVEGYSFKLKGVAVSDFVGPAWYDPRSRGPYDYLHRVKRPEQILHDGYATYWDGLQWASIQ